MRITESTVTKLVIDQLEALDPITVIAEDLEPRKGKITVSCFGKSWTAYWGGMGSDTIAEFFCGCDTGYIIGYFAPNLSSNKFSGVALAKLARREALKLRRSLDIDSDEARELFDNADDLAEFETLEAVYHCHGESMTRIFGDDWWNGLHEATEPNSDYQYLCRIIEATQQALATSIKKAA